MKRDSAGGRDGFPLGTISQCAALPCVAPIRGCLHSLLVSVRRLRFGGRTAGHRWRLRVLPRSRLLEILCVRRCDALPMPSIGDLSFERLLDASPLVALPIAGRFASRVDGQCVSSLFLQRGRSRLVSLLRVGSSLHCAFPSRTAAPPASFARPRLSAVCRSSLSDGFPSVAVSCRMPGVWSCRVLVFVVSASFARCCGSSIRRGLPG